MTQGERIKYIRNSRKMTQKQLGLLCGFSESTADVRIRQYESNAKAPKQDTLMLIAKALKVSYISIKNYDLGAAEDVLETLFWLDIKNGIDLFPYSRNIQRITHGSTGAATMNRNPSTAIRPSASSCTMVW